MLTRSHRLTSSQGFAQSIRRGRRAGTRTVVLHLAAPAAGTAPAQVRVGFVVSKAVGNAVKRNKVKRRLRDLAQARLDMLPASSVLVARALPAAAEASYAELARDFDVALLRVSERSAAAGRSS
jgi:ribonuclease P protein component